MSDGRGPGGRRMRLRYAGTCRMCGIDLLGGTEAVYERDSRTVRCVTHEPLPSRPRNCGVRPSVTAFEAPAPAHRV